MSRYALDTETGLIRQGQVAPPLVCVSLYDGEKATLLNAEDGLDFFERSVETSEWVLFNGPFDLAVFAAARPRLIPAIFRAYDQGRILDGLIFAKLLDVALGDGEDDETFNRKDYTLSGLVRRFLGEEVEGKGPDAWRMHYIELKGLPFTHPHPIPAWVGWQESPGPRPNCWPAEAIDYAKNDAVYHWRLWHKLGDMLPNYDRQAYKSWWLGLMGDWGVRTDAVYIDHFEAVLRGKVDAIIADLTERARLFRREGARTCDLCKQTDPEGPCEVNTGDHVIYVSKGEPKCRLCGKTGVAPGPCPKAVRGAHKLKKATPGSGDLERQKRLMVEAYDGNPPLTKPSKTAPLTCPTCGAVGETFDAMPSACPDCANASGGNVSLESDALLGSGHPDLMALGAVKSDYGIIRGSEGKPSKVDKLRRGVDYPLHPSWNALVATGRTSCREGRIGYQLQNPDRKAGLRECFVARPGRLFAFADYHVAELMSLSEVLLERYGYSAMADALLAHQDLHLVTAATILGISYEECKRRYKAKDAAAKSARQLAKALNFGLPGGMGAPRFYLNALGQLADRDCPICHGTGKLRGDKACSCIPVEDFGVEKCYELKATWLATYPEMERYFKDTGRELDRGETTFVQLYTGRLRGSVSYCDGCNTRFQGLTADGANEAMILVARECYAKPSSQLFGARPFVFVHDEVGAEVFADRANEQARRLEALMVRGMQKMLPRMAAAVRCDAALMRRWRKGIDPTYGPGGEILVHEDRPLKPKDLEAIRKGARDKGVYPTALKWGVEMERVQSIVKGLEG